MDYVISGGCGLRESEFKDRSEKMLDSLDGLQHSDAISLMVITLNRVFEDLDDDSFSDLVDYFAGCAVDVRMMLDGGVVV
jgi:hypothetical protein